ncbi:MAG TPA: transcriptional regulator [Nitrospirales bacterium]|nr:transcriptional regulator [Nitrospirales bacterium]
MPDDQFTIRQQIMQGITGTLCSARELSSQFGISQRQVDGHMPHILRSVSRDKSRRFVMEPSGCHECGYEFLTRTRLTRPSRCPQCRGKQISTPRYGIEHRELKGK